MRDVNKIDTLLREATQTGIAPGIVALATTRSGVIYEGAFGTRGIGDDRPMEMDTVFWIASMTKALAGTACMQVVEQGRAGLDDDGGRLVAALADPEVLTGFDRSGAPLVRPAQGKVTLRNLLTHTSGSSYERWNPNMLAWLEHKNISRLRTFQSLADRMPLAFDPGTDWSYGFGIDWAGKILEAVTGQSLASYLDGNVFRPLGMTSTGYMLDAGIAQRQAGMHQRSADGRLAASAYAPTQDPAAFMGGGGLYSTARDYGRFLRMMLNEGSLEGSRILSPDTVRLMGENHTGDVDVRPLRTTDPASSQDADFFPGMRCKWGLTFLINTKDVLGRRRAGSLSWAGLLNTYFWIDPASGIAGTIMTQMLPFADPQVVGLYEAFEQAIYDQVS